MYLARKFNGEIIAADSSTVYKDFSIGTAKPSQEDREEVKHYLLDLVEPGERYTVTQFQEAANAAIQKISDSGKLPILVGGSGLYIDAVIFGYTFGTENPILRKELEKLSLEELQERAKLEGMTEESVNFKNRRHLERAVERGWAGRRDTELRENTLVIGIKRDKSELRTRLLGRIDAMIGEGLIAEVSMLREKYGKEQVEKMGLCYPIFSRFLEGSITLEQAKEEFLMSDLNLAKRQRTWFSRNKSIHWVEKQSDSVELVTTLLSHS